MVKHLYLFRHGQTDAVAGAGVRYGDGAFDKLTELGKKQADLLGKFLADKEIDICFSSPFERSVHTAQIVFANRPQIEITTIDELKECKYQPWVTDPDKIQRSKNDYERACVAIQKILDTDYQDVAVSSHGGTTRALLKFLGYDIGGIDPGKCFCLENIDGKWEIVDTFVPEQQ